MKKLLLILLAAMPLTITAEPTQPFKEFFWVAPIENIDGSPLTDLVGFKIYCGSQSQTYQLIHIVGDPTVESVTFVDAGVPDGLLFCAMTAYDTSGNESEYSGEIGPFRFAGGFVQRIVPVAPSNFGIR